MDKKLAHYRLSEAEYDKICELLGRPPRGLEWALFSALWSEHCSYKSSRRHLKKFYSQSQRVLESFGENAGVIDLGEGERLAFKMESHNHPSYIEPYQGAATGVGGILRDIFTMGARPIALADFLCFGEPNKGPMNHLVDGVVRGISGYGNCVGVPTVTGQTEFHPSYQGNILVNAMAVGLFSPGDPVVTSKAQGPGNVVVYVGAKTGRDGVHGASMASESFAEDSASKRPTVQIGDPFYEKLLIESCLEVIGKGLVVAIQDMGAAGLTSSSFEMAAKGAVGLRLFLDRVPLRDSSITPEEILLSESQERMLLIATPDNLPDLKEVFWRWGLEAEVIGEVTEGKEVELFWGLEKLVSIDPLLLTENAPNYDRPYEVWRDKNRLGSPAEVVAQVQELGQAHMARPSEGANSVLAELEALLASVEGCSRQWIYQQYDQRVGARTMVDASGPVAALRLADSERALGVTLGLRPYLMRFDARQGAMDAVAFPALELAAKGFQPLAMTDCLNFGNPEKPEIMGEFVASIEAMSEICKELDVPVISGNVSFYNETQGVNITSTPTTGLVGLRKNLRGIPKDFFVNSGDQIYLLHSPMLLYTGQWGEMKGSGRVAQGHGEIHPGQVSELLKILLKLSHHSEVTATRMVGKMGLAYSLARMAVERPDGELGAQVSLEPLGSEIRKAYGTEQTSELISSSLLFHETLYQVLLTTSEQVGPEIMMQEFAELLNACGLSLESSNLKLVHLGQVQAERMIISDQSLLLEAKVGELKKLWQEGWRKHFATMA